MISPSLIRWKRVVRNAIPMPLIEYSNKQWAQSSSAQKTSIRKCCLALQDKNCHHPGRHSSGRKRKHPCEKYGHGCGHGCGRGSEPCSKSNEYRALVASIDTLSNSVNVMATCMGPGVTSSEDDDAKPAANDKMRSNSCNTVLTKNP